MGFKVERKIKGNWKIMNLTDERLPVNWLHYTQHMETDKFPTNTVYFQLPESLPNSTRILLSEQYYKYIINTSFGYKELPEYNSEEMVENEDYTYYHASLTTQYASSEKLDALGDPLNNGQHVDKSSQNSTKSENSWRVRFYCKGKTEDPAYALGRLIKHHIYDKMNNGHELARSRYQNVESVDFNRFNYEIEYSMDSYSCPSFLKETSPNWYFNYSLGKKFEIFEAVKLMLYSRNETSKDELLNASLRHGLDRVTKACERATKTAYIWSVITFVLTWSLSIASENWASHKFKLKNPDKTAFIKRKV